jgi:hypothetical protein
VRIGYGISRSGKYSGFPKGNAMKKRTNMYNKSVKQWNPFVGCSNACKYCRPSFQAQLKRQGKKNCGKCYHFVPHTHPERLDRSLPKTRYGQFIFTCSSGDIAFCDTGYLEEIVARITKEPLKTFLMQSKNPQTFNRISFPDNVILGTTLETNRDDVYEGISEAPKPSQRYQDFLELQHPVKMVTIEPVIEFDEEVMIAWIQALDPCMVWLGYDSRSNHLPEAPLEKVKNLHWELASRSLPVMLKTVRKAWWEQLNPPDLPRIICGRICVADTSSRRSVSVNKRY